MIFEYDPDKSSANKKKHGIDFDEAQAIWGDPEHLEIPAREMSEIRCLVIGVIDGKHWSAIITHRDQNVRRLISVRRSRNEEVKLYESI